MITQPDGHHRALAAPLPDLRPRGLRRLALGSLLFALVLVAALLGYRTGTGIASDGERPEAVSPPAQSQEVAPVGEGLDESERNPVAWLPARPALTGSARNKAARAARARRARPGAALVVDAGAGALP
jgi:hypothetical protein